LLRPLPKRFQYHGNNALAGTILKVLAVKLYTRASAGYLRRARPATA
jgi:hypothetical protein